MKEKRNKGRENTQDKQKNKMNKIHSKIVNLNPTIIVLTLNVNELNASIKKIFRFD